MRMSASQGMNRFPILPFHIFHHIPLYINISELHMYHKNISRLDLILKYNQIRCATWSIRKSVDWSMRRSVKPCKLPSFIFSNCTITLVTIITTIIFNHQHLTLRYETRQREQCQNEPENTSPCEASHSKVSLLMSTSAQFFGGGSLLVLTPLSTQIIHSNLWNLANICPVWAKHHRFCKCSREHC